MSFDLLVSILAGIALAAAAGLRAFLPLLVVNAAARFGWIDLQPALSFLESDIALVALLIATAIELAADKIPFVDHLLDVAATVLRPVAGILAGLSAIGELPEAVTIALALVLGGITLGTQLGRAQARVVSTASTGGFANPAISVLEDVASAAISLLAVLVPILAAALVLILFMAIWSVGRKIRAARQRRSAIRTRER